MQRRIQISAQELHEACVATDVGTDAFDRLEPHLAVLVAVAMAREAPLKRRFKGLSLIGALKRLNSAEQALCLAEQAGWLRLYPDGPFEHDPGNFVRRVEMGRHQRHVTQAPEAPESGSCPAVTLRD